MEFNGRQRDGDNWDRDASRVFHLPTKVADLRTEIEADDILTCEPDYEGTAIGTASAGFKKLPTGTTSYLVAIRLELKGQTVGLVVAGNASATSVETTTHYGVS
jgi:hypothetical protein